jgi:DNA-binding MarR family transcriptional regulator
VADAAADLDEIVHQRSRLGILAIAYEVEAVDFSYLQRTLQLTPGNLNGHLSSLESAGLIRVTKSFQGRRPLTSISVTASGRKAFRAEISRLKAIIARVDAADVARDSGRLVNRSSRRNPPLRTT